MPRTWLDRILLALFLGSVVLVFWWMDAHRPPPPDCSAPLACPPDSLLHSRR